MLINSTQIKRIFSQDYEFGKNFRILQMFVFLKDLYI